MAAKKVLFELSIRCLVTVDEPHEGIPVKEKPEPVTERRPLLGGEYFELTLDDFESP